MPRSTSGKSGSELHRITDRVTLGKAFQLAHSLYRFRKRDRQIALTIVSNAVNAVQVRLIAQHEADRHKPERPTKVRWNTQQWLQVLIYCKSEAFEKQQESENAASLSREDMIIRYVKHLILTTSRRNSFHTCLGLTRLVYDYDASETMSIYDLVFQDQDASTRKSDAYYRGRKNQLLEELASRFEQFVIIEQGQRGEKRFQSESESHRFAPLIVEYLTLFTPWDTGCKLPGHLDAWTTVHSLQFSQPNQIHSLIHPGCFVKITKALKLDDPDQRLALPRFSLGNEDSKTIPPVDKTPSELTPEEASEIRSRITEEAHRRKKFVADSLSVLADGIERARINLAESNRVRFEVEEDVNLIELVGRNEKGEVLMATHLMSHEEGVPRQSSAQKHYIVLEGGQKISLRLLSRAGSGDSADLSIEVAYHETQVLSIARLWWLRLKQRLRRRDQKQIAVPTLGFRLVVVALALITVGLILYFALRSETGERIAKYQPPSSSTPPIGQPTSPPQAVPTFEPKQSTLPGTPEQSRADHRPTPDDATREQAVTAGKSLLKIQRIYIESFGNDVFSQSVRQQLSEKLQGGKRFAVTKGPDEADAAISGSARPSGTRRDDRTGNLVDVGNVSLQLINVSGDIMWQTTYRGTAKQVANNFIRDLLVAIETEKRSTRNE